MPRPVDLRWLLPPAPAGEHRSLGRLATEAGLSGCPHHAVFDVLAVATLLGTVSSGETWGTVCASTDERSGEEWASIQARWAAIYADTTYTSRS